MRGEDVKIYTIGFTQKSAEKFFGLLKENNIKTLLDVRLNNASQLAGFAKGRDLGYFIKEILGATYIHDLEFAPTKEILDNYKKKIITWDDYEKQYNMLLDKRIIKQHIIKKYDNKFDSVCLLCSEVEASKCHRRLAAEYIKKTINDENIEIVHL